MGGRPLDNDFKFASVEEIDEVINKYPCKEVSIEITEKCGLECLHCSSEATKDGWENELTFNEIKNIIMEGNTCLGTEVISLSGGDPILRKDFVDIVKFIDELKLNILVYSSGCILSDDCYTEEEISSGTRLTCFVDTNEYKEILPILRKPGNKIIYSLEGANRFSHEFITRIKGSFDATKECIMASAIDDKIYTEVHTCPMTINMNELRQMYELLDKSGVSRWSLLRLVPQGRCSGKNDFLVSNKKEFRFILDELAYLIRNYKAMGDKLSHTEIRVGDPLNFYAVMGKNYEDVMPMTTCSAAKNRVLIRANGECQFCVALKHAPNYNYGNVRENSLTYLWVKSDMAKQLRAFHEGGYQTLFGLCGSCPKLEICKGGCLSQRIAYTDSRNDSPHSLCPIAREEED